MSPTDKLPLSPPRDPDEPSDLALDRLAAGELEGEERAAVTAAVARSPAAAARLRELQAGFPEPALEARLWSRIDAELSDDDVHPGALPTPRRSRWRRLVDWLDRGLAPKLALAAAAILGVVVASQLGSDGAGTPLGPTVRLKGGVGLTVHRQVAGGSEVVLSGATLPAGATLRFTVDAPAAGHLMVVDVDDHGVLAVAHPQDGGDASIPIGAGRGQLLSSAVALDDAAGDEYLYAVLCAAPFTARDVRPAPEPGNLRVPAGCTWASFLFHKGP